MGKKKKFIGYMFIVAGTTVAVCALVFGLIAYKSYGFKTNIEFEKDQNLNQDETQTDTISIPGFETWTIDSGVTKVSTDFYNPQKNTCYFVISVFLDETNEIIYESKYIKPGQHLYEVELMRTLDTGTYQATLRYSTYSMDDLTPMNGADVPFELVVK